LLALFVLAGCGSPPQPASAGPRATEQELLRICPGPARSLTATPAAWVRPTPESCTGLLELGGQLACWSREASLLGAARRGAYATDAAASFGQCHARLAATLAAGQWLPADVLAAGMAACAALLAEAPAPVVVRPETDRDRVQHSLLHWVPSQWVERSMRVWPVPRVGPGSGAAQAHAAPSWTALPAAEAGPSCRDASNLRPASGAGTRP